MKRRQLLVVVLLAAGLAFLPGAVSAQSAPELKLGFKFLAGQIPALVGEPVENEHSTSNGDSIQQTTAGMLVWRKADNWTAFTNGARTWVNGPLGLQERGNDSRFPWEDGALHLAASATSAPVTVIDTRPASQHYTPVVKAMDEESAGPSAMVKDYMSELDSKWATMWGWQPRSPVTIYLYFDGHRMAEGIASVSGMAFSAERKDQMAATVAGMKVRDKQTGGWGILVNLNKWFGTDKWAIRIRHLLTHEYTHVMQSDVASGVGPTWFHEGMAELSAFIEVPEALPYLDRTKYVVAARDRGELPSLQELQQGWGEMTKTGDQRAQLAYGVSYLAAKYLADRVGGMPLLQILQKTASGQTFEAALQSTTGYSIEQLDTEYRRSIPASPGPR